MILGLLLVVCFVCCDLCKFKFGAFSHIDLTPITTLKVDLSSCGENYHHLVFDLCKNLEDSECPSYDTRGPGNACDVYQSTSSSYYWLGEANNMTHTGYDKNKKEFVLNYAGFPQTLHDPTWTRNLQVNMKCDKKATEPKVACVGIEQHQASSLYIVTVESKDACPHIL